MSARISAPRTDVAGLEELEPLWKQLHVHHREVSRYGRLVEDLGVSWARRLRWYRQLLNEGGVYLTATDDSELVGYAMLTFADGPDDTFVSANGIPELVTLVIDQAHRSAGLGRELLAAAEQAVRDRGFDTLKIAVMAGNTRAQGFYEAAGYEVAELLLYRNFGDLGVNMPPESPEN